MKVKEYTILEDRLYSKEHEWIKIKDTVVKVGITDYAQNSLHEIVFVDLPERERYVERMDAISTAESVKAVSEIFTPLSGQIVDVNESLALNPELVNHDPYNQGWIVVIQPNNLEEEKAMLLEATGYAAFLHDLLTQKEH
jgi:glycine cleavage system H protein